MARMTSSTVGSSALTSGSRTAEMDSDSEMLLKWWLLGTADTSLSQNSTKLQLAKAPTIMFVLFVTDYTIKLQTLPQQFQKNTFKVNGTTRDQYST